MIGFGLGLDATSYARGEALIGPSMFFEVGSAGIAELADLRPFARATALWPRSAGWREPSRTEVNVSLFGGALDACLGSPRARLFEIAACSHTEVGSLRAAAENYDAGARSRPWVATGAVARARFDITRGFVPNLEIDAGVLTPLRRDRFRFEGSLEPVVAAPLLWTVSLNFGWELR